MCVCACRRTKSGRKLNISSWIHGRTHSVHHCLILRRRHRCLVHIRLPVSNDTVCCCAYTVLIGRFVFRRRPVGVADFIPHSLRPFVQLDRVKFTIKNTMNHSPFEIPAAIRVFTCAATGERECQRMSREENDRRIIYYSDLEDSYFVSSRMYGQTKMETSFRWRRCRRMAHMVLCPFSPIGSSVDTMTLFSRSFRCALIYCSAGLFVCNRTRFNPTTANQRHFIQFLIFARIVNEMNMAALSWRIVFPKSISK